MARLNKKDVPSEETTLEENKVVSTTESGAENASDTLQTEGNNKGSEQTEVSKNTNDGTELNQDQDDLSEATDKNESSEDQTVDDEKTTGETTEGDTESDKKTVKPKSKVKNSAKTAPAEETEDKPLFPQEIELSNKSPTKYTIPQLPLTLLSGDLNILAQVVSADQLNQIKLSAQTFNTMNQWDGISAGIILTELE